MGRKFVLICLIAIVFFTSGCVVMKGPFKGKVIDESTKQPVEGALVIAKWDAYATSFVEHGTSEISEADGITDKEGEFSIGPKVFISIPLFRWVEKPTLKTIYKPGYSHWKNDLEDTPTIELFSAKSPIEREATLLEAEDSIRGIEGKYPRYLSLIRQERKDLKFAGKIFDSEPDSEIITKKGNKIIVQVVAEAKITDALEQLADESLTPVYLKMDRSFIKEISGTFRLDPNKKTEDEIRDFILRNSGFFFKIPNSIKQISKITGNKQALYSYAVSANDLELYVVFKENSYEISKIEFSSNSLRYFDYLWYRDYYVTSNGSIKHE